MSESLIDFLTKQVEVIFEMLLLAFAKSTAYRNSNSKVVNSEQQYVILCTANIELINR